VYCIVLYCTNSNPNVTISIAGDPYVASIIMRDGQIGTNRVAANKLSLARRQCNNMVAIMKTYKTDADREAFLIRHLVLNFLCDYKARIASRYLLDWRDNDATSTYLLELTYYSIITLLLFIYILYFLIAIYNYGDKIGKLVFFLITSISMIICKYFGIIITTTTYN
jgi:hypothetical protein